VNNKNICSSNGVSISATAAATVMNIDGILSTSKVDDYIFDPGADTKDDPLQFQWDLQSEVKCFIDDEQTCDDYAKDIRNEIECFADVNFSYEIENSGIMCQSIHTIEAIMDGGIKKTLPLDEMHSCADKEVCQGDAPFSVEDKRTVNFCAQKGRDVFFEVMINGSNGNYNEYMGSYLFPMVGASFRPDRTTCESTPSVMVFEFDDSTCNGASNCIDSCKIESGAKVSITDVNDDGTYLDKNFNFRDEISISPLMGTELGNRLKVKITNPNGGKVAQSFIFDSSCSEDGQFSIGDKFGALELVGFQDDNGNVGRVCE